MYPLALLSGVCLWLLYLSGVAQTSTALAGKVKDSPGDFKTAPKPAMVEPQVRLTRIEHIKVCGDDDTFCGWPRQGGVQNFGHGEIVVLHYHAQCAYRAPEDLSHVAVHARSTVLLQRSTDGGRTWPRDQDVAVWRPPASLTELKERLFDGHAVPSLPMSQPGAVFYFHSFFQIQEALGQRSYPVIVLRSVDKGRTWSSPPALLPDSPSAGDRGMRLRDNHPPVRLESGDLLVPATIDRGVVIYRSRNEGQSWEYLSQMVGNPSSGRFTYAGLVLLRDGSLQGYALHIQSPASDKGVRGVTNAICMTASKDDGRTWGSPEPIVHPGSANIWAERPAAELESSTAAYRYRSPWPLLLRDGKVVVLFARRLPPYGIGAVVSSDQGRTWSDELILRSDGGNWDLGYPVATQLDDGRVFVAYYFNLGDYLTSRRFIGASFFRVE
jgi:hypothetical protein